MLYLACRHSRYARLSDDVNFYDAGISWLVTGHTSKLSLAYQNRPYFSTRASDGLNVVDSRRGAVILQYQVYFN